MEWLLDPTVWVGLLTLVVLEIVLGIDNLIFIAILAEKLPPHQRDRARIIGLSLALVMRLGLLAAMSWLVTLTAPLLDLGPFSLSGRDMILLVGGLFLLVKATLELHERLEGQVATTGNARVYAGFWVVVTQIVVLDAVFSLDAVITAVGMVDQLAVMMAAVIISIGIMLLASRPLTRFVNAHPTVVVLCLSFLLMIGFSLVAEGLGLRVPKGYLYAAIGFSILIETFNQLARRNFTRHDAGIPLRERTAEAVLRLLGSKRHTSHDEPPSPSIAPVAPAFGDEERDMVSGVLSLADRSIRSIMTPRTDMSWVDLDDDARTIREQLTAAPHSFFPVCRGGIDAVVGIGRAKDLIADLLLAGAVDTSRLRAPILVHESTGVLRLMDTLKRSRGQLVLVTDTFGAVQGLVTPIDVFEAIAGEFPDEDENPEVTADGDHRWRVSGAADLRHLERKLDTDGLVDAAQDYATLAGYLLSQFARMPLVGESLVRHGLHFEILAVTDRRIAEVRIEKLSQEPEPEAGPETE